ncbi:HAD-IB family hydrolase [Streptomyces sp. NPDC056983]|uniref:HAD-IB family hydrolase n=1 Tax=Streptomyces sp. NPDC056983 TaxID=3345987 RepID=UPI003635C69B
MNRAAFFDVDGTLTRRTTMLEFLEYSLAARGYPPDAYHRASAHLRDLAALGVPREDACRAYYRLHAGLDADETEAQGRAWFEESFGRGDFFIEETVAAFRSHAAGGELTVLISGSFPPCLTPIAEYLGADILVCSHPQIGSDQHYTGNLETPMIGEAKSAAATALAAEHALSLAHSTAYGDHISDLPLLNLVGTPVRVGTDPELALYAHSPQWRQLRSAVARPT